jgi:hypothetical protein
MALDENMPHMLEDHGLWATYAGNHVMISTIPSMTKASGRVPKP